MYNHAYTRSRYAPNKNIQYSYQANVLAFTCSALHEASELHGATLPWLRLMSLAQLCNATSNGFEQKGSVVRPSLSRSFSLSDKGGNITHCQT